MTDRRASVHAAAATMVALLLLGCGARQGATSGPTADDAPVPPTASEDPRWDRRPAAPEPAEDDPPSEPAPAPQADPPSAPAPTPDGPTGVAVPAEIADVFTLPAEVRVDDAGASDGDGATAVVQLTGEFVGGDLAAAAAAFQTALDDAGVAAVQEPAPEGVVFVAPLDRATLAIALLVDDGRTFVSVDLLVDRTA